MSQPSCRACLSYAAGPSLRFEHMVTNEEIYYWMVEQRGELGVDIQTESTTRGGFVWNEEETTKTIRFYFSGLKWPLLSAESEPPKKLIPLILCGTETISILISDGKKTWTDLDIAHLKRNLSKIGAKCF